MTTTKIDVSASLSTITVTGLDSLASGSRVTSNTITLVSSDLLPPMVEVQIDLKGDNASSVGPVVVKQLWSEDDSQYDTLENADLACRAITLNGTTAVYRQFYLPVRGKYLKLDFDNQDPTYDLDSTGNALNVRDVVIDQT